jgi:hypothetical protein
MFRRVCRSHFPGLLALSLVLIGGAASPPRAAAGEAAWPWQQPQGLGTRSALNNLVYRPILGPPVPRTWYPKGYAGASYPLVIPRAALTPTTFGASSGRVQGACAGRWRGGW